MDPVKVTLLCANILFFVGGVWLVYVGTLLLSDTETILLSRLIPSTFRNPLFYYVALIIVCYGLILSLVAALGCITAKYANYCLIAVYLFSIVLLLVGECVFGLMTILCPRYLGIIIDEDELLNIWQRYYGVPGKEQYTVAIDLVQTNFECCGANGGNDYVTSWWNLREIAAPNLSVPLSCCFQRENGSFLDPDPLNTTVCQLKKADDHQSARFIEGCSRKLDAWLFSQVYLGLGAMFGFLLYQLLLLLFTILACVRRAQTPLRK